MSSKTTNEDLLIVTTGSGHIADTVKPTDECFLADKKTPQKTRNWIPASACDDAEATQRTLVRSSSIVHHKSKIGQDHGRAPSTNDNFKGVGGGTKNGRVFFKHANNFPGDHSKNVRVEGHWIVRTGDETQQNKRNTTGKFVEGGEGITEEELEALLDKGCTVLAVTSKCTHRTPKDQPLERIEVIAGDVVSLVAEHVNDAEVDPAARAKPVCQVPRRKAEGKLPASADPHILFRVTRGAYPATSWREELLARETTYRGSTTLDLGEDWLGSAPVEEEERHHQQTTGDEFNKDPKAGAQEILDGDTDLEADRLAREHAENPTIDPRLDRQRELDLVNARARDNDARNAQAPRREASADIDAHQEKGRERTQAVMKSKEILASSWAAAKDLLYCRALEIHVEALACSGARQLVIAAYPPGHYTIDLVNLKEFKAAFEPAWTVIQRVRDFIKGNVKDVGEKVKTVGAPGGAVDLSIGGFTIGMWFLEDPVCAIGIQYRELTRDSAPDGSRLGEAAGRKAHEVRLAYTLDMQLERLIGLKFSYSIPLAGALGPVGLLLDRIGRALKIYVSMKFEIEVSVGIGAMFEWDEYGKIIWRREVVCQPVVKLSLLLSAQNKASRIEVGVVVSYTPKLTLAVVADQPFQVNLAKSPVQLKWYLKASISIWGWTLDYEAGDVIWEGQVGPDIYAL